jgi:hypothetical protein
MSQVPHLSGGKIHVIANATSDEVELSASFFSAVSYFIECGDTSRIEAFRGSALRGIPFETDPDVIEEWWLSTDFDFQEIYEP